MHILTSAQKKSLKKSQIIIINALSVLRARTHTQRTLYPQINAIAKTDQNHFPNDWSWVFWQFRLFVCARARGVLRRYPSNAITNNSSICAIFPFMHKLSPINMQSYKFVKRSIHNSQIRCSRLHSHSLHLWKKRGHGNKMFDWIS